MRICKLNLKISKPNWLGNCFRFGNSFNIDFKIIDFGFWIDTNSSKTHSEGTIDITILNLRLLSVKFSKQK